MKIELLSGGHVETDQLPDKLAEIHEAFGQLYDVCKKYDVTVFSRVLLSEKESLGMLYITDKDKTPWEQQYMFLVGLLSEWLNETSNGRLSVVENENYNGDKDSNV